MVLWNYIINLAVFVSEWANAYAVSMPYVVWFRFEVNGLFPTNRGAEVFLDKRCWINILSKCFILTRWLACAGGCLCHNCLISRCQNFGKQIISSSCGVVSIYLVLSRLFLPFARQNISERTKGRKNIEVEQSKVWNFSLEVSHFKWNWRVGNIQLMMFGNGLSFAK